MTEVDIVKRLRHRYNIDPGYPGSVNDERAEAADMIEQLRAECTQLKAQQKELLTNRKIYEG